MGGGRGRRDVHSKTKIPKLHVHMGKEGGGSTHDWYEPHVQGHHEDENEGVAGEEESNRNDRVAAGGQADERADRGPERKQQPHRAQEREPGVGARTHVKQHAHHQGATRQGNQHKWQRRGLRRDKRQRHRHQKLRSRYRAAMMDVSFQRG